MIRAELTGNLLQNPEQRFVPVGDGTKKITDIRVMSNVYRKVGEDFVEDKEKSRPVNVTIWSERLGDQAMAVLRKGMRVVVVGELTVHPWTHKENGAQFDLQISAEQVSLALNRVEGISMKAKAAREVPDESSFAPAGQD